MRPLGQLGELTEPITSALTLAGYRGGWSLVRRMPSRAAYAMFDEVADATYTRGGAGVRQLRANYTKIRPELGIRALENLVRKGLRSYMRYYCDAFRLPDRSPAEIRAAVRVIGDAPVRTLLADDKPVVCFLGHLGNWDQAGAWCTLELGPVTTVAERLKPEEVYAEFLAFRESLGMRILPLTGGGDVFGELRAALTKPIVLPLLADRDLTARGIPVTFAGHPVSMAAGPAALALGSRVALFPVSIWYEPRGYRRWRTVITFHDQVPVPQTGSTREKAVAMTQSCADALAATVVAHTEDWHMLQRFFLDDPGPAKRPWLALR